MKNDKMKICKACGAEISKTAKVCPHCGHKNKRFPVWAIILAVLIIIIVCCGSCNSSVEVKTSSTQEVITYNEYEITDLFDELNQNAMRAEQHEGEYVKINGYISTIDSDGKYFSIGTNPDNYDYMFDTILCYFTSDGQKEILLTKNIGDSITVSGKINDVGEVIGYSLKVDELN